MSRLTDLRTIFRGIGAVLANLKLHGAEQSVGMVESARAMILEDIRKEEEVIDRERAVEEAYDAAMDRWRARKPPKPWEEQAAYDTAVLAWREGEPVKPWREDAEYEAAMRTWEAQEPTMGPLLPPVK